jgi:hypothetical protein
VVIELIVVAVGMELHYVQDFEAAHGDFALVVDLNLCEVPDLQLEKATKEMNFF